jgi:protein-tyrosine-phosphatase
MSQVALAPSPSRSSTPRSTGILVRIRRTIRKAGASVRHAPDRLLHAYRRTRTLRKLEQAGRVRSVLMVCHGNICRSPFAAALLAHLAREEQIELRVTSAGFVGPRRNPPESALRAAARRQIDMSSHVSALVDHNALLSADLVCVMEARQASRLRSQFDTSGGNIVVLGDLDPLSIERRTIIDPWGAGDDVFEASYDRIHRCLAEMLRVLSTSAERGEGK